MEILIVQCLVLMFLAAVLVMWLVYFPFPSPLVRRSLPPRKRWPEMQIRKWLAAGRFQQAYLRYFYRDPERQPSQTTGLLAPADGLITSAEVRNGVRYLVIALSFWDMHVQRSPLSGRVLDVTSHGEEWMDGEGREFAFLSEKSCPVQKRVVLAAAGGEIAVRLITSLAARRIEVWVTAGDDVARGQRIGRILLGSTVVLELPESARLLMRTGERVWAGETVVAEGLPFP
ncbi:MAG: phosphatidylserine decarboxylase [Terracidiphilus sp.]